MNIPRHEHPNPIFMRKNFINLNGKWKFEFDYSCSGNERELYKYADFTHEIIVPFCPESKLSGIHNTDFLNCVWYSRNITIPDEYKNLRCVLHFGAVDYKSYVYVNGELVGTHIGGYTSFEFDITKFLKDGENTLVVCAEDDSRDPMVPCGKQAMRYASTGCHYTRSTGIWQTVWLEFVPEAYIKNVKYYPDAENSKVQIVAQVVGKGTFSADITYEGRRVGTAFAKSQGGDVRVEATLSEKHLWEVGCGRLYDVTLKYGDDEVLSYFGLRNVRLDGMKFLINEKSVFQRLVLDQGYYPDGIYTAPTDEDLKKDIELSLALGFNGARLHEKVFEPRFLYHCDKMGYIVWGEYANWGLDHSRYEALAVMQKQWREAVERDFNHPAIIGWCPYNETWYVNHNRQRDEVLSEVYYMTKMLDPTRPCIDTSGNYHTVTDIYDVHDYDQNPKTFKEHYDLLMSENKLYDHLSHEQTYNGEPAFVSEYGGIKWDFNNDSSGWGYGDAPTTVEEFIERFKGLTDALLDNDKMFAFCYTQLYDVEQEINGLYTYDRQPKFDAEVIKAIVSRKAKIED